MAAFSGLYPIIRMYAKGCPEVTMDTAIRYAAREFCRRTWWFQRTVAVPTVANSAYYDLDSTNTEDEILGVKAVETADGLVLLPVTQEMVQYESGEPAFWIYLPPDTLEVNPYPPADDLNPPLLYVRLALQPTETTSVISDDLMREWDHAIADGAIWYLTSIPQELWTNDKIADSRQRLFYEKISNAKSDSLFGRTPRSNVISLNAFNV